MVVKEECLPNARQDNILIKSELEPHFGVLIWVIIYLRNQLEEADRSFADPTLTVFFRQIINPVAGIHDLQAN
jgi:hypothetical protein